MFTGIVVAVTEILFVVPFNRSGKLGSFFISVLVGIFSSDSCSTCGALKDKSLS